MKVRRSAAAVGVKQVHDAKQAVAAFEEFAKRYHLAAGRYPLLQQAVPGDDYCTTFLFDHGQVRASHDVPQLADLPGEERHRRVARRSMRRRWSGPVQQLLGGLGWHGVAEVDFRWDGKSTSNRC